MSCETQGFHDTFQANVEVTRLTASDDDPTTQGYTTDIRVWCAVCGTPFRWVGPAGGVSYDRPTVNPAGTELRAPIAPADSPPGWGRHDDDALAAAAADLPAAPAATEVGE